MKLSAKGEYAVMAILELALSGGHRPIQVKAIARKQGIPVRFLEQVMSSLKRAGLVESIRGAQGGYVLAKAPAEIRLGDLLQAIDGPLPSADGTTDRDRRGYGEKEDLGAEQGLIKELWAEVNVSLEGVLNAINFEELCERKRKKDRQRILMYHI
ncbi:MAG TPA: Rrf2 family transcriptional regulator [Nitrospiria bacterium]|nr:Rrf2 family transcriptional regulator [Nitrospiria bacterium]